MLKEVDQKTLQAAIKALKINAPIYSAIRMENGSIQIVTRNGIQTWTPAASPATSTRGGTRSGAPKRKRKTQTPQRTRGRAQTTSGGTT